MIEANVATTVRLALQKMGVTLFRNTVGVFYALNEKTGETTRVRCGLGEGSADYIGWTEYKIKPGDVGRTVAVFTAIETKRSKGGRRSIEQQHFIDQVNARGGIAGFANSADAAVQVIVNGTTGSRLRSCRY